VMETAKGETVASEIKRTLAPKLTPAFTESMRTIGATRGFYLIPEGEGFPMAEAVTAIGVSEFLRAEGSSELN
jgi:hypothetical protein